MNTNCIIKIIALIKQEINYNNKYKDKLKEEVMKKFIVPKPQKDVTKTIRINEDLANQVQELADKQNVSFNKVVNEMIKFALENL